MILENVLGFLAPILIYLIITLLHLGLPGKWYEGYVNKPNSNEKLRYRLNGRLVLFATVLIWAGLCYSGLIEWGWLYEFRWYGLAGAITFGLIFSFAIVLPAPAVKKSFFADFFPGRFENPQLWGGRIDAKMWLYLVGAIMLELNILSFSAYHYLTFGVEANMGVFVATGLLSYFVMDYLTFEEVHLYTYDLFAERVGFKLGWGCIAFYPYFYAVPVWAAANMPSPEIPTFALVLSAAVFFMGWSLARGANMQKYFFKRNPAQSFLGIKPETITDGIKTLLVSGFWGLSRHINYLGEILMATGIVLCVGLYTLPWPWLYPVYYLALLLPRQMDDDKRCAAKYGSLWAQYLKKVPYRIIPKIY